VIDLLKEWAKTYFYNKDLLMGRKPKIDDKEDYILITNNDETHVIVIVKEKLETILPVMQKFAELENTHKPSKLSLVLYNNSENIDLVVKGWDELIKKNNLSILFVNPHTNNKWSLNPHFHNRIADRKSLKKGLLSLYSSVEPV
jgi:hypothetical protein